MTTNYIHAHLHILSILIPHFLCNGFASFSILCCQAFKTMSRIAKNESPTFIHIIAYPSCPCFLDWWDFVFSVPYKKIIVLFHEEYTGCNRRNVRDFGRVFLRSNYTNITQNTYIQSSMVTEIMAREKCGLLWCLRTVLCDVILVAFLRYR